MTGTVVGTLELQATDWTGVGTASRGSITLVGPLASNTDTVVVNSLTYTAVSGARGDDTEFSEDGTDNASAVDLAAAINGRDGAAITATVGTGANVVLIKAVVLGTGGDSLTLTEDVTNAGTTVEPTDGSLDGAEATGVTHMAAESVKFAIANSGATNAAQDYATQKAATGVAAQVFTLTTLTDPGTDTTLYLQASGDNTLLALPYSGALESTFAFGSTCN